MYVTAEYEREFSELLNSLYCGDDLDDFSSVATALHLVEQHAVHEDFKKVSARTLCKEIIRSSVQMKRSSGIGQEIVEDVRAVFYNYNNQLRDNSGTALPNFIAFNQSQLMEILDRLTDEFKLPKFNVLQFDSKKFLLTNRRNDGRGKEIFFQIAGACGGLAWVNGIFTVLKDGRSLADIDASTLLSRASWSIGKNNRKATEAELCVPLRELVALFSRF